MKEQAERLFEQALALGPERRAAFVEDACRGNPDLRQELLSLLAEAGAADQFFGLLNQAVFSASYSAVEGEPLSREPPDAELHPGEVIGQYQILSLIAHGGMGTVYRAHDTRLDRDVALKFLPATVGAQAGAKEQALAEARAAAALEHPNVCTIHQIGETDDGRPFIAMAFHDGETLKERLRRGPLSVEESVGTAAQISRALAAAHARGIIHRDVKPGNVMLGSNGTVRLLDFGLATVTDATLTQFGMTPGTVAYMSPEQARGDGLDPRTDLWSLGVVLYEMLAGVRPFQGESSRVVLQAILHQEAEPISKRRPELPEALTRIVDRLLRKEPADRYGSGAEVLTDLARVLPSGIPSSQPTALTRRRAALLAGGAMLVAALVGIAVWPRWRGPQVSAATVLERGEPSIVVFPLANLSPDPQDAVMAQGMTNELISILAGTGDVRVIAGKAGPPSKDRETDLRNLARRVGVSNILDGGVQKIGSRLRMQIRLVDVRDGSTRWSQTYDREFKEVFSVQDEIAQAVVGELGLRFDKDKQLLRHRTRSIAAYEHYIRGWDPVLLRTSSGIWKALEHFQKAIAADSTYAAAYAGMAITYIRRASEESNPEIPIPKLLAIADDFARKAVTLDESLAEAHYAWGRVRLVMRDLPTAEREIQRAITLDPARPIYHRSLYYLHTWTEPPEEQLAEARRIQDMDPMNPYGHLIVSGALICNRRYDEALAELQHVAAIQPPLQGFAMGLAEIYTNKHMWAEALAALRPQAEAGEPNFVTYRGYVLGRAGRRDEAKRVLAEMLARRERGATGAYPIAVVYAGLGEINQAFTWLDKSVDDNSITSGVLSYEFDDLHGDPRFERLMTRLGLQKR
jgi:TolB-like protein